MKTSSIFKKASVFAIAVTMALLMVVSILPAAFATDGANTDAPATTDHGEKLNATNISISGCITMEFYYKGLETFADNDYIEIKVPQQGGGVKTTRIAKEDIPYDEIKERWCVEVSVAYAQQSDLITLQWFKGGEAGKIRTKSVKDYAKQVFDYAKSEGESDLKTQCLASVDALTTMLNCGAMAQKMFNHNTGNLANADLYEEGFNPVDNMLPEHFYDLEPNENKDTSATTGVKFVGGEVFLQSKVNLRIYLTCPDEITTAEISNGETTQTVWIKTDAQGRKYVGINNVVANQFNVRFNVKVGEAEFNYSILDYAYDTLNSYLTTEGQKDTAKALYLFYAQTREFVDSNYTAGPKKKTEDGKLVVGENGAPVAAACTHTRTYVYNGKIICSDCGHSEISSQLSVNVVANNIRVGETGEVTLTFFLAGTTEYSALVFTPLYDEALGLNYKAHEVYSPFDVELGLNGLVLGENNANFASGKIVKVTYTVNATKDGSYTITLAVREATDANGTPLDVTKINTGSATIEVKPAACDDHTLNYMINGETHKAYCPDCKFSKDEAHTYTSKTTVTSDKLISYTEVCECGALGANNFTNSYTLGFALDADDSKTTKAPILFLNPSEIAAQARKGTRIGAVAMAKDGSYVTIHNKTDITSKETDGHFYLFNGNTEVTGRYLAIKYRTTTTSPSEFFVGANNGNAAAAGGENFYLNTGAVYVNNGEWHVAILDLAMLKQNHFLPNEDGTYTAHHVRWDIFNNQSSDDQSVDIAYVAMSDDVMSLASFNGNDYYRVATNADSKTVVAKAGYMASTKTLNVVADAEWIRYTYHNGGNTLALATDSVNGGLKYTHITRKGTNTDSYVFIADISNPDSETLYHYAHTTDDAKYMAFIYRADDKTSTHHEAFVKTTGSLSGNHKFTGSNQFSNADGQWHIKVVDMSKISTDYYDPTVGMAALRFDYWNASGGEEGKWIADLAFFGVFGSEANAYEYCINYLDKYVNVEGGQGHQHDYVNTDWTFISNEGTEYEGTRYAVEAMYCTSCGEIGKTRAAVVAVNFDTIHVDKADGTDTTTSWGTGNTAKAGDITKRIFNISSGNYYLRDNKIINGGGWAGINGLFSETAYYRVLDKDGNVLLDWTAKGNSRVSTNAGDAVQKAVNNQIGPNTDLGVTSDSRRFTINEINLSAYASYYQAEDSRHENAPIIFEYALQAEGAPEGSDLVMVVKITDIYKTCTSHQWHTATVEENGNLTVYTECKNCGHVYGSYTMDIGNKAPNYFVGAADLADRVAKDSKNMSTEYTLSEDGSYVTLSNTADTGDGYVNLFSGNKTVTGRYLLIKYRTKYTGGWQFYTCSNSTTAWAAGTTGDSIYFYTPTYGNNHRGGIKNDGNWSYTVIDLAGVCPDAFKKYDDGTYMAQFFRWDIFDSAVSSIAIDVAYMAFADSIETLEGMDCMVTYDYAYTRNGSTAIAIPMSPANGKNNPFFNAHYLSVKGKEGFTTLSLNTDANNNNMPYVKFNSAKADEQYFNVWQAGASSAIPGSGKYIGVLYRAPKDSCTSFEFFVSSNRTSAIGGCNKSVSITADNQWRFAFVDISTLKTSDGAYWYKDSDGLGQVRFDVFNGTVSKTGTIDIAFLGFFDGIDDIANALSTYNELYGLVIPNTPLTVNVDKDSVMLNETFSVTVGGAKGTFTSGTFTITGLPAGSTVAGYTLGAGVTATVKDNVITITAIDNKLFTGTVATVTYKTFAGATAGDYTISATTSLKNGTTSVSSWTSLVGKDTLKVKTPMNTGLWYIAGTSNLKGNHKITEANGLTYHKYISGIKNGEYNIDLHNNATNKVMNATDYFAVIYRAPKTVMVNGTRVENKIGWVEAYVHSTATSAQSGCASSVYYTANGMWSVAILDLTKIGDAYDPAAGLSCLRFDYINGNPNSLIVGAEVQIAFAGFVASPEAGNEWLNTFLSVYYPEGQTEYVTPDVCSTDRHTNLAGWVSAGVAEDGNLLEKKVCASCNTVMETRNVYFRGWMNGYYINDTKINSGNLYQNSAAIDLAGKGVATTVKFDGWFATESGVHTYYYRVNGGEWIAFTNTELFSKENSGIKSDVDGQNKGIDSYWTNAQFNGHLTTGDLTIDYAGQTVTLDFGFAPNNNPTAIQLVKTFTNLQVDGKKNLPTYVYLNNVGGNKTLGTHGSAFVNNTALTTSTSAGYEGRIYISGRVGIEGTAQKLVYRLLDANGNQLNDEWQELDYYSSNNYTMKDVTGTSHLGTAQGVVPEVTNVYEYVGMANITAFPGQTVTVECALVLDGVEGEDAYYTFMTFTNVTNTESAS